MANQSSLPLYERVSLRNNKSLAVELLLLFLLLLLLTYHFLSLKQNGIPALIAFLCECFFTFVWILVLNIKWNPIKYVSYPDRLLKQKTELPAVDMFVTTADAELEPPIITMNTVLSLLAVDYPVEKLACYLSDDSASLLTYYSLVETSKFAKFWLPFCKKYDISVRAPFRYFATTFIPSQEDSSEFQQEWKLVKDKYEMLCQKIEDASNTYVPCNDFPEMDKDNHRSIVKILTGEGVPHLVYISREKRPEKPHHFKAGALNALTRVSGLMTNAPFILNVDCDMYANNPQVVLYAMCMFFGIDNERDCAFVQFAPGFYDGIKDDPFGNQYAEMFKFFGHGTAGIQGPPYNGTNCFHRRKVIYDLSPDQKITTGELSDLDLQRKFGKSSMLKESVAHILSASTLAFISFKCALSSFVKGLHHVLGCDYEYGTCWGTKIGWKYGSQSEDILTSLGIHRKGWKSMYCTTDPASFLGCAPQTGPETMIQAKRRATDFLEILLSFKSPILATINGKLQFRQCLAYMWIMSRSLRSIPELVYSLLPAYCIITGSRFLPKVSEPAIIIPIEVFLILNIYTWSEYLTIGLSTRAWWNNQRMARITCTSSWLFATFTAFLKLIGLSQSTFEVAAKNPTPIDDDKDIMHKDPGKFTFSESLIFLPGTTMLLVNLTALVMGMSRFLAITPHSSEVGIGELLCSLWIVLYYWEFLKGLFGKGKYGIPSSTIVKSGALASMFTHFCIWSEMA